LQAKSGERLLIILPMSHIFTLVGCVFVPLYNKLTAVILNTIHPRYIFDTILQEKITHITSVPEIFELLLKTKTADINLPSLKTFVSGGSVLTEGSYNKIKDAFSIDLLHGYGLTEFTPVSRNMRKQARAGTIGPVCEGLECKIINGELMLKAQCMTKRYYKRPKETQEAFMDGWFKTGDLCKYADNHLVFKKEKKNTRKMNGTMVDLEEIKRGILMDSKIIGVEISYESSRLSAVVHYAEKVADLKKEILALKCRLKGLMALNKIPTILCR
jgi:long-chain acyl-CoA synthetase